MDNTGDNVDFTDIDSIINNLTFPTPEPTQQTSSDRRDEPMAVYPPRNIVSPPSGQLYPVRMKTQVTDKLSNTSMVKDITIVSPTTIDIDGVHFTSLGRMNKVLNSTSWTLQKCYFQIQVQKNRIDSVETQVKDLIEELKKTNNLYQQFIHIGEEQVGLYFNQ
jgi:hypothetical protein